MSKVWNSRIRDRVNRVHLNCLYSYPPKSHTKLRQNCPKTNEKHIPISIKTQVKHSIVYLELIAYCAWIWDRNILFYLPRLKVINVIPKLFFNAFKWNIPLIRSQWVAYFIIFIFSCFCKPLSVLHKFPSGSTAQRVS